MHPDDIDYPKLEKELDGQKIPIATIKIFIDNVSPFVVQAGSKDQFLNGQIEDFYL